MDSFERNSAQSGDGDPLADIPSVEAELVEAIPSGEAPLEPVLTEIVPATGASGNAMPLNEEEREELIAEETRRKMLLAAVPSWIVSLLVHVGLIVVLAAVTLDPVSTVLNVLEASESEPTETVDNMDIPEIGVESSATSDDPLAIETPELTEEVAMPEVTAPEMPVFEQMVDINANAVTESIMPSAMLSSNVLSQLSSSLSSRSAQGKAEMLERFGGTAASEKAVARALRWLAKQQLPDGGWNFVLEDGAVFEARSGATAMALLPFLGAGQTHLEGQYKAVVRKGLAFLIRTIKVEPSTVLPTGSWHDKRGRMYSHSCAAIAVCEAYAMTKDPDLLQPAQLSLNYLVKAQHPAGGWRYSPGQAGDTSAVGWCLMALKSGRMGGLAVPSNVFRATDSFLDSVSHENGTHYGYTSGNDYKGGHKGCNPVGVLCRMYLGYDKEEEVVQNGVEYLDSLGPDLNNFYYSYYATQVMRHYGGEEWDSWNAKLRDKLIAAQVDSGPQVGSWLSEGGHVGSGGRLAATSFATMMLEVYYRHMPLYSTKSSEEDFEI
ncbi:MAG: prenyltransferase/squalene oxidase repeat-containing protein [Planctomycetota bacterium]|nr:prenyltransferase/squalene oxidase repeat-containing protein [Planctomycetota bacterium]